MTRKDFINAMPPMPDSFVERMERTLKRKEAYIMKRNRAKRLVLIAALIGVLLIAGCAVAFKQSGVLDYLFYDKQPTKEAIELVQPVDKSETGAGVSITIDEYAYDGENVVVSYTLTNNTDKTLIVYNEQGVGFGDLRDEAGSRLYTSSGWMDDGDMFFLGGEVNGTKLESSINCGQKGSVSAQSRKQTLTLTVSAGVYRPLVPLASSDETAGEGDTLVIQGNTYRWSSARNEAAVASWAAKGNDTAYEGETLEAMGWIEKIGEVSVSKTLEPKRSEAKGVTLKEPIEVDAGDVTFTLESVELTALDTSYVFSIKRNNGEKITMRDVFYDYPISRWRSAYMLDGEGEPAILSGGGSVVLSPDGTYTYYSHRHGNPLTSLPDSFVFCPEKEGFDDRYTNSRKDGLDLANAIRLDIVDGVIVPPETPHDGKVIYASDFASSDAGTGEILSVKAKAWDTATITRVLAGGKKLEQDKDDPGDFRRKDGTIVMANHKYGELYYINSKLGEQYGSTMLMLKNNRVNTGGSIEGFTPEQALSTLDITLQGLGLKRGRTAYISAFTKKRLMETWVEQQVADDMESIEKTQKQQDKLRAKFEKKALSLKTPKGGYYITFALNYNGLDCVIEDRPTYGWTERLPAGSSLTAFVNPDGVMYMQTYNYSAVYEAAKTGASITPISLDAAKAAAEKHLSRGTAERTIEIKRALYEYKPVWSGENDNELTLRPAWGFYAEREDKALYPLVHVDAEDGGIL